MFSPPQVLYAEECQTGARSHAGFDREVSQISHIFIYIYIFPLLLYFLAIFSISLVYLRGNFFASLAQGPSLMGLLSVSHCSQLWTWAPMGQTCPPSITKTTAEKCSPKALPFISLLCCPVTLSPAVLCFWLNTEMSYNPSTQTIFERNCWFWSSWGKKAVRKSPSVYTNKLAFEIIIAHQGPCWLFTFFFLMGNVFLKSGQWMQALCPPCGLFLNILFWEHCYTRTKRE